MIEVPTKIHKQELTPFREECEEGVTGLTEQLLRADMLTFGEQMQGLSENDLKKILIEYGTSEHYIKRILEKRRIWVRRRRTKK